MPYGPSYFRPNISAKNLADFSLSIAGTIVWLSTIDIFHLRMHLKYRITGIANDSSRFDWTSTEYCATSNSYLKISRLSSLTCIQ